MSQTDSGTGRADENPYSLKRGLETAEPLNEGDRKVQDQGGKGISVCVNLTEAGARHHGIEVGEIVTVRNYEEGILIMPVSGDTHE